MAKVAMNLNNLSVNEKIAKGRAALTAAGSTEGVAVLGTPAPAEVAALLAATDALEVARDDREAKANAAMLATQAQADADAAFNLAFSNYARVGQNKSGGDATSIRAIGLAVAGTATAVSMTQVLNLAVSAGDEEGSLDAQWDPVRGARIYKVQISTDLTSPPQNWTDKSNPTRSRCTLTGLTSGQKLWIRVKAIGANDEGPWSDVAWKMVP
jgi:hypothetical protein